MTAPLLRSNRSVAQVRLPGADAAPERTQGDTGAHVGALIEELADCHARSAAILKKLSVVLQEQLAAGRNQSVMDAMPLPEVLESFVSVSDISELLGVHPKTVRSMRKRGELPNSIDLGSVIRWRRSTILDWLRELEEKSQ